jgi:hypothetical protein
MSRYQLRMHGWSIGGRLIPEGTIIDDVAGQDDWSKLVRAKELPPPLNAQPLDQPSYDAMKAHYGDHTRWVVTGPGVRR